MPYSFYACLQDEDKIATFAIDAGTGRISRQAETPVAGGPSVLAVSPDRRVLYLGHRTQPAISSFRIDQSTGALTLQGTVEPAHAPTFLATDRTGRYLLSAYYQGGYVAVHPLENDGAVGRPALDRQDTANGAHAIQTDPSNQFAFVPHIARLNDNVLEPPKNNPGPNFIAQFRFNAQTGRLAANSPFRVEPTERLGPATIASIRLWTLSISRTSRAAASPAIVWTGRRERSRHCRRSRRFPPGTPRATRPQIHLTPSGRFLYVGNRGHNRIAGFAVDTATEQLSAVAHASTEAVPSAFAVDPAGRFVLAAGTCNRAARLLPHQRREGALSALETYAVGQRPAAVLITRVGS